MTAMSDLSGTELGRYRLLQILGAGGMGAVYEALDVPLGRRVALKLLPPELVADERRVRRFAQEARTASALNHPHLIAVYDIGPNFIAMEKVDGATLRELVADGALPLERALELMQQIADAVAAAHGVGVIHRDLKPENVMVSRDGYAKVLDFGLAKLADDMSSDHDAQTAFIATTQTGFVLGTPGYMAPEQAQGRPADARADIFALGCLLYELASGRRAFRGSNPMETLHKIVHEEPEPIAGAPAELQRILRKAMAKDPNARYQSARDLSIDVRDLLRDVRAGQARPSRPRGTWWLGAAALAVAVIAVLAFVAVRMRRADNAPPPLAQLQRLTTTGDVTCAAISPDGKFISFVRSNTDGQSLWLRQLGTSRELQLIAPQRVGFWGNAFTPDGAAIVYGLKSRAMQNGAFFRISVLGGTPEHLLDGIDSPPSFSPDGARMTYVRADFPKVGESALMIASSDGTGARPLATRTYPERFAPVFFTGPAWSPDGKTIVTAVDRAESVRGTNLYAFDAATGKGRALSDGAWYNLGQCAWLPDMQGVVVQGARDADLPPDLRLWLVPYPSGKPRPITNDLLSYRMPTLTADGRTLLAVGMDTEAHLWRVPLGGGAPAQIANNRITIRRSVTFAPDGRVIFVTLEDGRPELVIANADGSNPARLTRSQYGAVFPAAFRTGVAYLGVAWETSELHVGGFERGNDRIIKRGIDFSPPSPSPDGAWIAYHVNRRLWKCRADGSGAVKIFDAPVDDSWFSPDGTRIAILYNDGHGQKLAVIPADGGPPSWSMPLGYRNATGGVRWTPDGKALLVDDYANNANVWKIPFDGPPQQLTTFEGDSQSWAFDVAPDGKSVAMVRGHLTRDAILIKNFR